MDAVQGIVVNPSTDTVAYGKHGEQTYQELWDKEPVYCLWTVNKFKELVKDGDELETKWVEGDSKLKRLAQWIMEVDAQKTAIEPEFECDSDMEMVEVEKPENQTLEKRVAKIRAEGEGSKFYGVAKPPEHAGVYTSWAECKPHVMGIKGVMYKSFSSEEEAAEFVRNPPLKKSETPEAIAARQAAVAAKEAKTAEAKAAREEANAAKEKAKEEAKAAKEEAKAAKLAAKEEAKAKKQAAKESAPATGEASAKKRKADDSEKASDAKKAAKADQAEASTSDKVPGKSVKPKVVAGKLAKKSALKKGTAAAKATAAAKSKASSKLKVKKAAVKAKSSKAKETAKGPQAEATASASAGAATPAAKVKKSKSDCSKAPESKSSSSTKSAVPKAVSKSPATPTICINEDVANKAESLGMKTALQNLASRAEIVDKKFNAQALLDALVKADGLVNKAKGILLSPGKVPEASAPAAKLETPEKVQLEKHDACDLAGLADTLSAFSQTLRMVSAAPKEEKVPEKQKQFGLSEEQQQRIKENRERALARRIQMCGS